MNKAKIDPYSGEIFIAKRYNQIYANRENQIKHNNLIAYRKRQSKKKIDSILDSNRTILAKLLGNKDEIIKNRDWLLALNYNFGVFTHSVLINEKISMAIYEYILIKEGNDKYKILRNENY